jgi:N6-adenosine-specific RNA methylase IME4
VYADPPWEIKYIKETKKGIGVYELPYKTMTDAEIIALPIKEVVADNAILFMWVVDSRIGIMPEIMKAWGFRYVTVAFVWNKLRKDKFAYAVNANIGKYTKKSCEFCFVGTRGRSLAVNHTQLQYLAEPKREHSRKPDRIRKMIVSMCGDLPRLELFARQKTEGWDVFGNEVADSIRLAV